MKMNAVRNAALVVSLAVVLAAGAGCKKQPTAVNIGFPETNEVSSWAKSGATRTFAAAELSNYIDGEAEKYLKAGVRSASTSDYKFGDQTEAVADVYTMSTAEGAKTVFESEPAADAKSAPIGDAARLYTQSLVFRKGPYLVRIVAYQASPPLQQAMVDLGHGIEKKLPQ
jgi:hypothetical protein